jgi:hypothetical protein
MTPTATVAVGVELVERGRHPFGHREVDALRACGRLSVMSSTPVAALGEDGLVGHGRTI